jgi:ribose transport system permease protein
MIRPPRRRAGHAPSEHEALRTQITMSGLPKEYRTLVTGVVVLIFAAADALASRNERV